MELFYIPCMGENMLGVIMEMEKVNKVCVHIWMFTQHREIYFQSFGAFQTKKQWLNEKPCYDLV